MKQSNAGFGTLPVFMATITTILGAILFLRFGYAVGHIGFWATLGIIALGHIVTIATALAIAEIATNQKVEGGGAYYMISRSFGINIGGAIGIALYMAQAISVAFYVIAFGESFDPVIAFVREEYGLIIYKWMITLPVMALLTILILSKGAGLGVKALYIVGVILFASIIMFFMGQPDHYMPISEFVPIEGGDDFFYVFIIIFPAFTGIAAGLGLSGDLKNPKRSIPLGTLSASLVGMIVYVFVAWKLAVSAPAEDLANNQLIMQDIAIWGPIIPIGLACATISSALGSIMIAPRTLQALGKDEAFGNDRISGWLAKGKGKINEPFNADMVTCAMAFGVVLIGDVNVVAEVISMFFMVTYGAVCTISVMEHFAADPAYRPTFKSKWWISAIGAILCFWLMFRMNPVYAIISIALMVLFYFIITYFGKDRSGLANIFQGVIHQLSRNLQIFLRKAETTDEVNWRPSVICISKDTFKSYFSFDLLKWISHKYGFGTYIHHIEGYVSKEKNEEAKLAMKQLIDVATHTKSKFFIDTIISPSTTSAIAQVIQLPSASGREHNLFLFDFNKHHPDNLDILHEHYTIIQACGLDVCVLGSTEKGFGIKRDIHIWMTTKDYVNANLMILLGFIIMGHPDWKRGAIKIFDVCPEEEMDTHREKLIELTREGRLPISPKNIELIPQREDQTPKDLINKHSQNADLTIVGYRAELLKRAGTEVFSGYDNVGNVLFVNALEEKSIT